MQTVRSADVAKPMYVNFEHLEFRYEPFPIGLAKPIMDDTVYAQLLDSYPPLELFKYFPKVGHKYSLSQKYNPRHYHEWIESHRPWRDFHAWVKSDAFVIEVIDALRQRHIELGFDPTMPTFKRVVRRLRDTGRGRTSRRSTRLRSRFEFSMLPVDGGHVLPHTDSPSKVITLIISMLHEGEWDPSLGGGTDVNAPKDVRYSFNHLNRQAGFDDMDVLDTFEFTPNQAVAFVKTFNSWHSVRPMNGDGTGRMRKTLTINIEAGD